MTPVPYIIGASSITVMVNGATHTVTSTDLNFENLREAIKNKSWDSIPTLVNPAKVVESFCEGLIEICDGEVYYGGNVIHNSITRRILSMMAEGFDASPMINFLAKLMKNPSMRAVNELYGFLEATSLPITEDGDFLAYKKVKSDYKDYYTGKMDNSVGKVLSMPRNSVDEDKNTTCSYGLHFCSLSYLPHYYGGQGRIVIVKINPANVVAIPADYNNAKGRACEYEVVGEHTDEYKEAFSKTVVGNHGEDYDYNEDEDEDDEDYSYGYDEYKYQEHIEYNEYRSDSDVDEDDEHDNSSLATMVMGVDFKTEFRANFVKHLLTYIAGRPRVGENKNINEYIASGYDDGFHDGYNNRMISITRYSGYSSEKAVMYANSYFQGYDRARERVSSDSSSTTSEEQTDLFADNTRPTLVFTSEEDQRLIIAEMLKEPFSEISKYMGYPHGKESGLNDGILVRVNNLEFDVSSAVQGDLGYRLGYVEGYSLGYNNR